MFLHCLFFFLIVVLDITLAISHDLQEIGEMPDPIIVPKESLIVSPALQRRLQRLQELTVLPTVTQILQLLEYYPDQRGAQVAKRLRREVNDLQHQVLTITNHFLETPVTPHMSRQLIDTVLFLAQDDYSLFRWYMTHKERGRFDKAVKRYQALPWPENRDALEQCVGLLRAAKALRDMVVRLHQLVELDDGQLTEAMRASETHEMIRVALRRMALLCRQHAKQLGIGVEFTEEAEDYLLTLSALVVDRGEQQGQLLLVLTMWQNECLCTADGCGG